MLALKSLKLLPQLIKMPIGRNVSIFETLRTPDKLKLMQDELTINVGQKSMRFPYVWLRDNCQCKHCFHGQSKSRIINWKYFDVNQEPSSVEINGSMVNVVWKDDHLSTYDIDWLNDRDFAIESRRKFTDSVYRLPRISWSESGFKSAFNRFDYNRVLSEDEHLKSWIESLSVYGVALITGAGTDPQSCRKLANRIEFIKRTHYGEEWIVMNKPDTTNVAYLSSNLQLHVDLPYYDHMAGVNLLHCITQSKSEGGVNLLTDGLYVAEQLKKINKDYYNVLRRISIDWEDFGEENGNKFHSLYRSPVICEAGGEIVRINCSVPQRGSHMNADIEDVKLWYEAWKAFTDLTYKHAGHFKVAEGEILSFDNKRLLHGRTEYKDTAENMRYVIGAYLDWDYINSRRRVLKSQ